MRKTQYGKIDLKRADHLLIELGGGVGERHSSLVTNGLGSSGLANS
jgi:hypothetical protein